MKISNDTLEIFKNFATINSGILVKEGSVLSTVSSQKNILVEATIKDVFPVTFGIYDINNFLSVVSLFKDDADLDFHNNNVVISGMSGRSKIYYRFASESTIVVAPDKRPTLPSIDISFDLTASDLEWLKKTASVLGSPNISVKSDGSEVNLVTFDDSNDSAHSMSLLLKNVDPQGVEYNMIFKAENLKLLPGNYTVEIYSKGISTFTSKDREIKYWITTEQKSKFGG